MKPTHRLLTNLGILMMILSFTCCKNVEFKPSHISLNINESKSRKVFICEYVIIKKNVGDTIDLNCHEIWLERKWSNYLNTDGEEKTKTTDSTSQLIINFKDDHIFSKNLYWDKFIIKDDKGNVMGSDKGVLSLDSDTLSNKPLILKLLMIKVENKYQTNIDTITIGELLLERR